MKSAAVVIVVTVVMLYVFTQYPVPFLLTGMLLVGTSAGKGRSRYGRKF